MATWKLWKREESRVGGEETETEIEMKAIIDDLESKFTRMESDLMRLLKAGFHGHIHVEVWAQVQISYSSLNLERTTQQKHSCQK